VTVRQSPLKQALNAPRRERPRSRWKAGKEYCGCYCAVCFEGPTYSHDCGGPLCNGGKPATPTKGSAK